MIIATCRQFTGQAWRFRAYLRDTETGGVIWACPHKHRSRLKNGGKNGEYYAMRCANQKLKRRAITAAKGR